MYSLGVLLFWLFFGSYPVKNFYTSGKLIKWDDVKDHEEYKMFTSGELDQMNAFLLKFNEGVATKYSMSLEMRQVLTMLLARDP